MDIFSEFMPFHVEIPGTLRCYTGDTYRNCHVLLWYLAICPNIVSAPCLWVDFDQTVHTGKPNLEVCHIPNLVSIHFCLVICPYLATLGRGHICLLIKMCY